MTDQPVDLPAPETIETQVSIPPALAAVKPRKIKAAKAAAPFVASPSIVTDAALAPVEPTVEPTAAAPADIITEEPIMATTIENVVDNAADNTHAFAADMNTRAKDAMEKTTKLFADLNGFTKDNVEAMVESGKLAVAGLQTMASDRAAYVRKQFDEASAAARTIAGVKSPTEFVKLQGDYVRQQFDGMVAEASRSTEAMLKLAGEVVQPISNRVAVAVERIKQAA